MSVYIDDHLPGSLSWDKKTLRPSYTKMGPYGGWWGPFLEKAAAKYYGHYYRMTGGWMSDAFDMLTGQPTSSFSNNGKTV
jgi:hypothetical protein